VPYVRPVKHLECKLAGIATVSSQSVSSAIVAQCPPKPSSMVSHMDVSFVLVSCLVSVRDSSGGGGVGI
jgi:hypothetical protein